MVIIFSEFLMLDQILSSPEVKPSLIINNKLGIYKLSHKLPNDLTAHSKDDI